MNNNKPAARKLAPGEYGLLSAVVADLADDGPKLVYADWLEEQGDFRAVFLRSLVKASRTLAPGDFPATAGLPEAWIELTGYRLLERIAVAGLPELKAPALRLARPALRMQTTAAGDRKTPVGASKIGGAPDLPPGFPWPKDGDCQAVYSSRVASAGRLAGFLAQVNFAEIADAQAVRDLPKSGVLSFFSFQNIEDDNPDEIGACAFFFPDPALLVRTNPPESLPLGNGKMPTQRLTFEETLDLPSTSSGPWTEELLPDPNADYDAVFDHFRSLNFTNFLGYARSTSGDDPTPSRSSRHLILLTNSVGCRLHLQLLQPALTSLRFDQLTLNWVDFD